MSLNLPQNLLFKINTIEDNSKNLKKNTNRLKKPILIEDYKDYNNLLNEKKTDNINNNEKKNNISYNPFIFNKNNIINSNEDISFKMTFDTLSNINFNYPYSINFPNITDIKDSKLNINNIINLGGEKIEKDEDQKQISNSKLKKKRKFNKFKVSYIEPKAKNSYKFNHKRKYKPDDIRKKIKARFHKSIKNIINENLKKAGSKYLFSFLPQIFISSISRQTNSQVLNLTYRQLLETDFVSNIDEDKYKNKKVDYSKYQNNLKVLEYLDNNPDIYKTSGFDILGNMKYSDLLEQYFNSEEFDKALLKLKEEKEEDDYIEEYKNKAKTYVQFFSGSSNNSKNKINVLFSSKVNIDDENIEYSKNK